MKVREKLYGMYNEACKAELRLHKDLEQSGEPSTAHFTYRDDWVKSIGYRTGLFDAISYLTGFEGYLEFLEGVENGVQTGKED